MAAPSTDWTLIRITGHLRDFSANELTGTCTFTPNLEHAESDATNMFVVGSTLTATFVAGILKDAALNSYIDIPATNDPDIEPTGWSYRVVITTALKTISWDCVIPITAPGGTLDLTDLAPVVPTTTYSSYVLHTEYDPLAATVATLGTVQVNIRDYAPVSPDTDWGAACQRAIDALPAVGGTVYIPPNAVTYTFDTAPILRRGVTIKGGGRDATQIVSTAGGFTWTGILYYANIRDLKLRTASGGHMFTPTATSAGFVHCTITGCELTMTATGYSIFYMNGACSYIDNSVENCDFNRPVGSTVPGWYLFSSAGGVNCNTWRRVWAHSNNNTAAPFFHLEASNNSVCYDNHFEDVIGEQNAGGLIKLLAHRNPVLINVVDYDTTVTYQASVIYIAKAPGFALTAKYPTLINCGSRSPGAKAAGVYDIDLVPGEVVYGTVIAPNGNLNPGDLTMNLASDTVLVHEGKVTAPTGLVTGTATKWSAGAGTPESAVTGAVGDLRSRTDGAAGTTLYTKQTGAGNTGWAPLVPNSRQVSAGTGLTGGGDLSADRTLTVAYGTSSSTAAVGNDPRLDGRRGFPIAAGGEWSRDRALYIACPTPLTSGRLELVYFMASATETINTLKITTSSTAGASLTLVRYCVYTVAGNGDLTLINSTVSDTSLLVAANTVYPKALSSSWSKTAGTLYAVGLLVTGTTMPTLQSDQTQTTQVAADLWFVEPRRTAHVPSLSDLPSTVANASLVATRRHAFVEMTT